MKNILAFLIVLCFAGMAVCADYVLIVNKDSPLSSASSADIKRVYTGKIDNIGSTKVEGVNLPMDNATTVAFLKEIVGTTPTDYKSFWLAQQIRGGSSAPAVKKSSEDMLNFIKGSTSAIGYVPKDVSPEGVKILTVN